MKSTDTSPASAKRLIDIVEVQSRYPVSRSTLWRQCRNGVFPAPRKCGRRTLWDEQEVDHFLRSQPIAPAYVHIAEKLAAKGD
jgi:predicted DNA-binding transcriptional regulator AlpA